MPTKTVTSLDAIKAWAKSDNVTLLIDFVDWTEKDSGAIGHYIDVVNGKLWFHSVHEIRAASQFELFLKVQEHLRAIRKGCV